MVIKINGKAEPLVLAVSLEQIIKDKGLVPERIIVEHNFKIVPYADWCKVTLQENDNLEILSFVGGG